MSMLYYNMCQSVIRYFKSWGNRNTPPPHSSSSIPPVPIYILSQMLLQWTEVITGLSRIRPMVNHMEKLHRYVLQFSLWIVTTDVDLKGPTQYTYAVILTIAIIL